MLNFFTCDLINGKRRFKDLKKKNHNIKLSEVKRSIKLRNIRDKNKNIVLYSNIEMR